MAALNPFQALTPGWFADVDWTKFSFCPLLSFQHPINVVVATPLQSLPGSNTAGSAPSSHSVKPFAFDITAGYGMAVTAVEAGPAPKRLLAVTVSE